MKGQDALLYDQTTRSHNSNVISVTNKTKTPYLLNAHSVLFLLGKLLPPFWWFHFLWKTHFTFQNPTNDHALFTNIYKTSGFTKFLATCKFSFNFLWSTLKLAIFKYLSYKYSEIEPKPLKSHFMKQNRGTLSQNKSPKKCRKNTLVEILGLKFSDIWSWPMLDLHSRIQILILKIIGN